MNLVKNIQLTAPRNLITDVENRTVYNLNNCELSVFETYRKSEQVQLTFHDLVITSMVRGKKIMYLPGTAQFDYHPGETVLAPSGTRMVIDFPEAKANNPTQCIALTLDNHSVSSTVAYLNEYYPRANKGETWNVSFQTTHLKNSTGLADVINKMVAVCTEKAVTKDVLADLTMKELIVRLVQLQYLQDLDTGSKTIGGNGPFSEVTTFIRDNLYSRLDIALLSKKACMSRAQLFRSFRREYGITPAQYIIKERLKKAKNLLANSSQPIQQISLEAGFEDVSNFIRIFRKSEGTTPGVFRSRMLPGRH